MNYHLNTPIMTMEYLFLIVLMALTPFCVGWTHEIKPKMQIKTGNVRALTQILYNCFNINFSI